MTAQAASYRTAYALGIPILLWIAVFNGFPMLFADSGAYLRIGTEFHFPTDRPVTYGLAILPLYRIAGLWAVAVAQAIVSIWLIGRTLAVVSGRRDAPMLVIAIILLAIFSSLPWFVGQVMPDLFAGLTGLLIFLIVFGGDRLSPWERRLLPLVLAGFIAFHLSYIVVAAAVGAIAVIVAAWTGDRSRAFADGVRVGGALLLTLLGLCSINLVAAGRFRPSLAADTFLFARLLDGGVAQAPFRAACARQRLSICAMLPLVTNPRQSLPGQAYLWDGRSPRGRLEAADPARVQAEEAAVVRGTFRERPLAVVRMAADGWARQVVTARAGDGLTPYAPGMQVVRQLDRHFPAEVPAWQASRQQNGRLQAMAAWFPDRVVAFAILLGSPLILIFALRRRQMRLAGLTAVILATILSNAAACGVLSGVFDRYQSRVLWLLPLLGIIALRELGQGATISPDSARP